MASCKAFLKDINKRGEYKVWVKYTHKSKWKPFGTGITISPEFFDKGNGIILQTHPKSTVYNIVVQALSDHLMSLAHQLQSKLKEPMPELVRELYDEAPFIQNRKTLKDKQTRLKSENQDSKVKMSSRPVPYYEMIKDLALEEALAVDFIGDDLSSIVQKLGSTDVVNSAEGKRVTKTLTGTELMRILTPHFKNDKVRFAYFDFRRLANIWIESNVKIKDSTRNQRRSWLNVILNFSVKTDTSLAWEDFDHDFYTAYGNWLMFGKERGINEHDLYNNSFGSHVKRLKVFLSWVEIEQDIKVNPRYKRYRVLKEDKHVVYLDKKEIDMLWEFVMPPQYNEEFKDWRIVQDLCVFGCLTGLRISDIKGCNFDIEYLRRHEMLSGITVKTKHKFTIPLELDERIEIILKRYTYNLDLISEQTFNKRIKEILKEMYIHHNLYEKTIKYTRYKFSKPYKFEKYKNELFASHCNRRSAITNWLYDLELTETDILSILGGKSITELKKYIANDPILSGKSIVNKIKNKKVQV